ncbi:response regulator transcription factor [Abyssisolibacter fermentans]|uniref:response regulator transcription factor n=1 Tax=Abyssisolibacter fermentans TaxID=1766203 RepID=UPI00082FBEF5|nr:response regulator transcription factor [Abyssisolibacter fermentans]
MSIKILVADDEENIANSIAYALKREQYEVYTAYDGEEAMDIIKNNCLDILILDIMMPKVNGYDVLRKIVNDMQIGIIMLTAKSSLVDKVLGLELGADDYVTKPFDIQELIARVRSLCRRLKKGESSGDNRSSQNIICVEELKINIKERVVCLGDNMLHLKPKEFDLLTFLLQNNRITFTRDNILDEVWGQDYFGGTRTVDIHIQRIRKKLGKYGVIIKTVPKIGYKAVENLNEN